MMLKVTVFHYVLTTILLLKRQACKEVSESELFLIVFDACVVTELAVKIHPHVVETSIKSYVAF